MRPPALLAALPLLASALPLFGCSAVYPEIQTPLRTPPSSLPLEPPPSPGVYWIGFREGTASETTRDGRKWHELGSDLPDPFAVLRVNGEELLHTNKESHTLHPTWPGSPHGNFRFAKSDRLRVEMWEAGLVNNPMCVKDMHGEMDDWAAAHELTITCDGGATVTLSWEPAHGQLGYGFYYELRAFGDVGVTRVFAESPAARAGLRPGDKIIYFGDRPAKNMQPGDISGYVSAQRPEGIRLQVKHEDGTTATVAMKEGAVYPLFSEIGSGSN